MIAKSSKFAIATAAALAMFATTMYSVDYRNYQNNLHEQPALPTSIQDVDVSGHTIKVLEGVGRRYTVKKEDTRERRITTYTVNAFTQIFINGTPAKLEELQKGMKVYVVARGNVASRIEVGSKEAGGITSPLVTMQQSSPTQMKSQDVPKVKNLGDSPEPSTYLNVTTNAPVPAGPPRALIDDVDTANRTVTLWGGAFRRPKTCTIPLTSPILINNNPGKIEDLKKGMRVEVMLSPSQNSLTRLEAFEVVETQEK